MPRGLGLLLMAWSAHAALAAGAMPMERAVSQPLAEAAVPVLQNQLLQMASDRLRSVGLFVDRSSARFTWSQPPRAGIDYETAALWSIDRASTGLPMPFRLTPVDKDAGTGPPDLRVVLAAKLQAEVWTVARDLDRGAPVTCADLAPVRRDLRSLPKSFLPAPCDIQAGTVALRSLAPRDIVRSGDLGQPAAVRRGAAVRVVAAAGGVAISAPGTALTDADVGESVRIRMSKPFRVVTGKVTAFDEVTLAKETR